MTERTTFPRRDHSTDADRRMSVLQAMAIDPAGEILSLKAAEPMVRRWLATPTKSGYQAAIEAGRRRAVERLEQAP